MAMSSNKDERRKCIMEKTAERKVCGMETEVYSRIVGYFRPVKNWNQGKKQEFEDRKTYNPNK